MPAGLPGTGTPATSPRFGVDRFSQADDAVFSPQFNQMVDAFDNAAKLSELITEISRAEGAEASLAAAITTGDTAERDARIAAINTEADARSGGDKFVWVQASIMDDQTSPWQTAGSIIGHIAVPTIAGQAFKLKGTISRAISRGGAHGGTDSEYKILTDTGHGDGSLSTVTGLASVKPTEGRAQRQAVTSGGSPTPLALNDLDTIAIQLVTVGTSKGISLGLEFTRG